jgi:hypothetical protein
MKLKDEATWNRCVEVNSEPYGKAAVDYAEAWANLMETKMSEGKELEDIADSSSHDADTDGITGFMYGAAVSMLAQCWEHGEQLRRWHNLKTQIKDEGAKANTEGGTLNPALLNIVS